MIEQKWNGVVTEIDGSTFWARLQDQTVPSNPEEIAQIPFASVAEEERSYIAEGVYFTWTILADEDPSKSQSTFEFNKEVWTQQQIDEAKERVKKLLDRLNID